MSESGTPKIYNAVLVGIQLPNHTEQDTRSSLEELARLVTTLGYKVVGQISQKQKSERGPTVIGKGKLMELASWTGGKGIVTSLAVRKKTKAEIRAQEANQEESAEVETEEEDASDEDQGVSVKPKEEAHIVIFDCDLTPSQLRNLEIATEVKVLDRTGVIIEIFSKHARTRAARLQVEIAKLAYMAPRLRETSVGEGRQGGGAAGRGAGESALELDKRKIRDRIKELKEELASLGQEHSTRRARREQELCVALVGYTNAGKSSLMRALTGSEVLIADKLFATLDTTIRPLYPESQPKILISDTVGFIKKLPHDLVASFKSTLDEALNATLLLFVVDAADPAFRSQLETTKAVLAEVGATDISSLLILNKQDKLSDSEKEVLRKEFPEAVLISTRSKDDLQKLRNKVLEYFETDMIDDELFIPYSAKGIIGEIRSRMRVLSEAYDNDGVKLKVRTSQDNLNRMKAKLQPKWHE